MESAFALALAVIALVATPARALITRVWVSSTGVDQLSCGAVTSPCRTFQYVHDNIIAAGGEIDVRDAGAYGALVIRKAISIINDGVGTVAVTSTAAASSALFINAGPSDRIFLRGLSFNGSGIVFSGVSFWNGGSLDIAECRFLNFSSAGLSISPNSDMSFSVSDTVVSNVKGSIGVSVNPNTIDIAVKGTIKATEITASGIGLAVSNASVFLTGSNVSNNKGTGLYLASGDLRLSRTDIVGNQDFGVLIAGGTIYSNGDNHIVANDTNLYGGVLTPVSGN